MNLETAITSCVAVASLIFNLYQFREKQKSEKSQLELSIESKKIESASQLQLAKLTREERFIEELEADSKKLRETVKDLESQRMADRSRIEELQEKGLALKLENTRLKAEAMDVDEELKHEAHLRRTLEERTRELVSLLELHKIKY